MIGERITTIIPEVNKLLRKESPITAGRVSEKLKINLLTARTVLLEIEKRGRISRSPIFNGKTWWVRTK